MMTWPVFNPVTDLPGVGVQTAAHLASLGLYSIYDLIYDYPFRYDDLTTIPLSQVQDGQKVVLQGVVATPPVVTRFGYRKSRLSFKLRIDHEVIMVNSFNQPWLAKSLELGQEIAVYGKYELASQRLTLFKKLATKRQDSGMAPIYPTNRHLRQPKLQQLIQKAIATNLPLPEVVPLALRTHYRLLDEAAIVQGMHYPRNQHDNQLAQRSAIFREFFLFQMQLAQLQVPGHQHATGFAKNYQVPELSRLTASLPFALSADQKQVLREILADLKAPKQMRRLLQGDVGSGKTIVAVYALYAAVTAGYQAAIMVPTELLANQHFHKISALLIPLGVRVALLTASTKPLERREIYQELTSGMINVVIGTHALIQSKVIFKQLGIVIIDEQHRFGVAQRQALIAKGNQPDVLAMTATPIPRTLALTVYGEMAVSEIHRLPAGRKPVQSRWCTSSQLDQVYAQMNAQLAEHFQIYVVTPLISDSETLNLKSAEDLFAKIKHDFPSQRVELLHGQLPADQKDAVMADFVSGEVNILVTTSVIEVGVDVSNANMMVIYNADHFGLSQLHQLRGRIGRGQTTSYCYFVADPKTDAGKARMKIVTSTRDGFKLAEADLKMRGEGNLFGKLQSGVPDFKVGDVVNHYSTMVVAQKEARKLALADPNLTQTAHAGLKAVLDYQQLSQMRE